MKSEKITETSSNTPLKRICERFRQFRERKGGFCEHARLSATNAAPVPARTGSIYDETGMAEVSLGLGSPSVIQWDRTAPEIQKDTTFPEGRKHASASKNIDSEGAAAFVQSVSGIPAT